MQCRVYKITLVAGAGIVGIVKVCQEEICASWAWFWRDLKSFNDSWRVEHARCGFGANNFLVRVWLLWCLLPMRWLFSVRSVSLMERPFPVRPFPVQHTHTLALNSNLLFLRYQSVNLCLFLPFWLGYKQARQKTWGGGRQWQMAPEILWKAITSTPHKMQFPQQH